MKILFVDKVMTRACGEPPRGVELFNVNLLRELSRAGVQVTALLHASWIPYLGDAPLQILPADRTDERELRGLRLLQLARADVYDLLLLGNVANRLVALVLALRAMRICRNCVLIAHREPSRRTLWAQKVWPDTGVVAVNDKIAGHFLRSGFRRTSVYYGVTNADRFLMDRAVPARSSVAFCVAGNLDNAWKGADTAVAAFRLLPAAVRARCELHLASFHTQPQYPEPNIIPHGWMPADAMPAFFQSMDVMIVPSRDEEVMRETFSQVMVQGMLSGLPIITTSLPILSEKLDMGGGIVTGSVEEMAQAMERLACDGKERQDMGQQARETARSRYVWDTGYFVRTYLEPACRAVR